MPSSRRRSWEQRECAELDFKPRHSPDAAVERQHEDAYNDESIHKAQRVTLGHPRWHPDGDPPNVVETSEKQTSHRDLQPPLGWRPATGVGAPVPPTRLPGTPHSALQLDGS